jgi:hypothetical protein
MKQPKTQTKETTGITITTEQCSELFDVCNMISELSILSEHADDQPWTILKMISDKAGPLADDLFELKRKSEQ